MKAQAGIAAVVAVALAAGAAAQPQQDFDAVVIESTDLGSGIHMLTGSGGNIGLLVGEDGVLMIDDQYAPLSGKIAAKVEELGGGPVRFLINTHYHPDHAGGNAPFAEMGATVIAHDNTRRRLGQERPSPVGSGMIAAAPEAAWPIVTFAEDVTFHMNGQTVHAFHVAPSHTDGDVMIYFEEANVLHGGDVFTTSGFPLIDGPAGGSLEGFVAALDVAIERIDDETKVIPGHGPLSTRADVAARRDALQRFVDILKPLAESELTIEEILAARPLDSYDEGFADGFVSTDSFITSAISRMRAAR